MSTVLKAVAGAEDDYSDDDDFSEDFDVESGDGGTVKKAEELLRQAKQSQSSSTASVRREGSRASISNRSSHHRSTTSSPPRTPRKVEVVPPVTAAASPSRRRAPSPTGLTVLRSRRGAQVAGTAVGDSHRVKLRSTVEKEAQARLRRSLLAATTAATRLSRPVKASAVKAHKSRIMDLAKPRNTPPELHRQDGHADTWIRRNLVCTCEGKPKRAKCTASRPLPGCGRATLVHASVDDGKNCKFRPTLSKKSRAMVQDAVSGNDEGCIIRMEAKERARRSGLEEDRARKDYMVRLDKLCCPACGTEQSYAEWRDGVKRCSAEACGKGLYKPRLVWSSVESSFLRRQAEWQAKKQAAAAEARRPPSATFKARASPRHTKGNKYGFGRT